MSQSRRMRDCALAFLEKGRPLLEALVFRSVKDYERPPPEEVGEQECRDLWVRILSVGLADCNDARHNDETQVG